jgi:hypothetical protein
VIKGSASTLLRARRIKRGLGHIHNYATVWLPPRRQTQGPHLGRNDLHKQALHYSSRIRRLLQLDALGPRPRERGLHSCRLRQLHPPSDRSNSALHGDHGRRSHAVSVQRVFDAQEGLREVGECRRGLGNPRGLASCDEVLHRKSVGESGQVDIEPRQMDQWSYGWT